MANTAQLKEEVVLSDGLSMMFEMLSALAKAGVLHEVMVWSPKWSRLDRKRDSHCSKWYNELVKIRNFRPFFCVPTSRRRLSLGGPVCVSLPQPASVLPLSVRLIGKCQRRDKSHHHLSLRGGITPPRRMVRTHLQARMVALLVGEVRV
jgi:hypothetical protein